MRIAILYAMESEIESILKKYENCKAEEYKGVKIYYAEENITLCAVGIGKVNAAYGAAVACEKLKPDLVISAGVAGSFRPFGQNTVLIADRGVQHDFDTSPIGDPRFCTFYNTDFVNEAAALAERLDRPYCKGLIATGDQFMTENEYSRMIAKELDPIACEMEAGAEAVVCARQRVKFAAIKTASDCLFTENQTNQYSINLAAAAESLNAFVIELARELKAK